MSGKQKNGDYEIGHGRPPKDTQFKKGQSGNPKGRPKGSKNTKTVLTEVLNKRVEIREGGKAKRIPLYEALMHTMAVQALQGDARARTDLFKQMEKSGLLDAAPAADQPTGLVVLPEVQEQYQWEIMMLTEAAIKKGSTSVDADHLKEIVERHLEDEKRKAESGKNERRK